MIAMRDRQSNLLKLLRVDRVKAETGRGFCVFMERFTKQHNNIASILSIKTSLMRLIDDILDISKNEAGMESLNFEPAIMRELCLRLPIDLDAQSLPHAPPSGENFASFAFACSFAGPSRLAASLRSLSHTFAFSDIERTLGLFPKVVASRAPHHSPSGPK